MKTKTLLCSLGLLGAFLLGGCEMTSSSSSKNTSSNTTTSTHVTSSKNSSTSQTNELYGEYKETSFGSEYVTKVKVTVDNGVIKKVEIMEGSNIYTDGNTWPGNTVWTEKEQEVLKSYEGKSVEEIKNSTDLVVDNVNGATLSSNRLYKAIKDALK